ncbi:unnamed protein product [Peronospora belbahrii]|uniref:Elicitin n=1 Tax=Peronospora belbahrii TaxID=622444 RepID=A0AAU9KSM2_9STRA|nr:unnamed protein product [Peronospora belbahrii]CAH0515216.1 unnamed protein product [Peronospora belbahrii]
MRGPVFALLLFVTLVGICSGLLKNEMTSKDSNTETMDLKTRRTRILKELSPVINEAEVDSKTFALQDSYDCDNGMVAAIRKFFKANDATFDTCISDSGYQIYPYTGILPDSKVVTELVSSSACMGIITAVVMLNLPPCILNDLAMRAACETILVYSVAMRKGVEAPMAEKFYEVVTWRHHVDLAKAAKKPFDGESRMYRTFAKYLHKALVTSKVKIMHNLTVVLGHETADYSGYKHGQQSSFISTNSSADVFVGKVIAANDDVDDASVMTATKTVTTRQSSDSVTVAAASMTFALTLLLAAAVL